MIVGLGTGTLFSSLALPRNLIGVADAEGEFLVTDDGTFVVDDAGRYILTNTHIKNCVNYGHNKLTSRSNCELYTLCN